VTTTRHFCKICQAEQSPEHNWFLLIENEWEDRIKILQWNDVLAKYPGVHCACSTAHTKQLVAHWMATGSLDHPFALAGDRQDGMGNHYHSKAGSSATPDVSGAVQLGELAVHRETLRKVLEENPHSLSSILEALVSGLERNQPPLSIQLAEEYLQPSELQVCFQ